MTRQAPFSKLSGVMAEDPTAVRAYGSALTGPRKGRSFKEDFPDANILSFIRQQEDQETGV